METADIVRFKTIIVRAVDMENILSSLCLLYLSDPPSVEFQNGTYQLYPIDKRLCPKFSPYKDTIFELYTRQNPTTPDILMTDDENSVKSSKINFKLNTIIFFHGFLETSQSDDSIQIRNHYLNIGNYNIILVNNARLLAGPYYPSAARNVLPIGKYSAKFVDFLVKLGLKLSNLHIIGMSLGGQIAGLTGKYISSGKAYRVTGLEPAGPLFDGKPLNERINKDAGEFVDIIHTNAGIAGTRHQSGHVDIWVNGGSFQPGCSPVETLTRIPGSLAELVFCNHYQAYRMYVMSLINATAYPATKCDSHEDYVKGICKTNDVTYLGVDIDRTARGNYYVNTGVTAVNI